LKMTTKYLHKRKYLGFKKKQYWLLYGLKNAIVTMEWVRGEYRITAAELTKYNPNTPNVSEFPYKKTVGVIDTVEELVHAAKVCPLCDFETNCTNLEFYDACDKCNGDLESLQEYCGNCYSGMGDY